MKSYFYQWDIRLGVSDWTILYGGVRNLMTQKIYEIANERQIKITQLNVSDVGISIIADSDPGVLIRAAEKHLRLVQISFRVDYPLLKLTAPQPAA